MNTHVFRYSGKMFRRAVGLWIAVSLASWAWEGFSSAMSVT